MKWIPGYESNHTTEQDYMVELGMVSYLHRRQVLVLIVWANNQGKHTRWRKMWQGNYKTGCVAMHSRDTSNAQCKQAQDCSILLVHNRNSRQIQQCNIQQQLAATDSFCRFFFSCHVNWFVLSPLFFSASIDRRQRQLFLDHVENLQSTKTYRSSL